MEIEVGDRFTIAGANRMVPRKWWQFWKPRMIDTGEPIEFVTTGTGNGPVRVTVEASMVDAYDHMYSATPLESSHGHV